MFNGINRSDKHIFYYTSQFFDTLLGGLKDRYKYVIIEKYQKGRSIADIAESLKVVRSRASMIEARALIKMRSNENIGVLTGKSLHSLISCLVPRKHLTRAMVMPEYAEHMPILENIVRHINKQNNSDCSLDFILGLEYLGILKGKPDLNVVKQRAKKVLHLGGRIGKVYLDVCNQGKGLSWDNGNDAVSKQDEVILRIYLLHDNPEELVGESSKSVSNNDILNKPIEELNFSIRAYTRLKRSNLNTVGDIVSEMKKNELQNVKQLTPRYHTEVVDRINSLLGKG